MTAKALVIECDVHFGRQARGRKELNAGPPPKTAGAGRVPRVAKLLALAHRFEQLLRTGVVRDYAELGRLAQVTRARISQIMSLLLLAPGIQEEILFLPPTTSGRDRLQMRHLLPLTVFPDWPKQRNLWADLRKKMYC
jgi:hypothetical protein